MRRRNAQKLIAAGAVVTIGTDNYWAAAPEFTRGGTKPDTQNHGIGSIIAIEGLVELGMTPAQAIVAATKNGATASRAMHYLGTVEKGKRADGGGRRRTRSPTSRIFGKVSMVHARRSGDRPRHHCGRARAFAMKGPAVVPKLTPPVRTAGLGRFGPAFPHDVVSEQARRIVLFSGSARHVGRSGW